ncbi:MAG: hypothetical protein FJZ79_06620 [Chlorobi bacterium]|nr:hypothetical protein [Chlorobiota bacterium]
MSFEHHFIPDIDRYCDRRCERCSFRSPCRHFSLEQRPAPQSALADLDVFQAGFWLEISKVLDAAERYIRMEAADCSRRSRIGIEAPFGTRSSLFAGRACLCRSGRCPEGFGKGVAASSGRGR